MLITHPADQAERHPAHRLAEVHAHTVADEVGGTPARSPTPWHTCRVYVGGENLSIIFQVARIGAPYNSRGLDTHLQQDVGPLHFKAALGRQRKRVFLFLQKHPKGRLGLTLGMCLQAGLSTTASKCVGLHPAQARLMSRDRHTPRMTAN